MPSRVWNAVPGSCLDFFKDRVIRVRDMGFTGGSYFLGALQEFSKLIG